MALVIAALALSWFGVGTAVASTEVEAFEPRFQITDRGSIVLVGNTLMTCPNETDCASAQAGTSASSNSNNNWTMADVDVDGDASTHNSSRANLNLPAGAEVLFAGLYWGADSASAARGTVQFALPGESYQTITTTDVVASGSDYSAFADVTDAVRAASAVNGTYTLGDVQRTLATDQAAGWALVVAYRDPAAALRSLTVFDGYLAINTSGTSELTTSVSGFTTPAAGPVNAEVGMVAFEGDRGFSGDLFQINGTTVSDAQNPATNFFNSTVSSLGSHVSTKEPNYVNQLGFDIDLVNATGTIGNSATSADLTFDTSQDVYFPTVLTFAVDVHQPVLEVPKSQVDTNGGALLPGDEIAYTVFIENTGNDTAVDVVLTDLIPAGTTFVPGSAAITTGAGTGPISDDAGDDLGEYVAAGDQLVVRVGDGATTTDGGDLAPGESTTIVFRVAADDDVPSGTPIENTAQVAYSGLTLGGDFVADSDGDGDTPGVQPTEIVTNGPPTAADEAEVTVEDVPVVIDILANDTDPDDNIVPSSVTIVSGPSNGTVTVAPDGTVTYTPDPNFNGTDTFTYEVCDSGGLCDEATVTVSVTAEDDPPVAGDDSASTTEDTPVVVDVVGNDTDPDGNLDPASVAVIAGPSNGTVTVDPVTGEVTYTPNANFAGTDTFTYEVCDSNGECDTATVTVDVVGVNDPPTANDDAVAVVEDTPQAIDVLGNDSDPDGPGDLDPASVTVTSGPANGTVTVDPATGEVTYTPNENFNGTDSFTYEVCDRGAPPLCDVATVTVNVGAEPDAPEPADDTASTPEDTPVVVDVLGNDSDPDGPGDLDPASVTVTSGPANGTVTVDPATGEVTYTPNENFNGTDSFTYEVCDIGTPPACATATVTVTVTPVNDAPVARDDAATTPEETPVEIPVLANDVDVDGLGELDPASITIVGGPANGTVTVDPATGVVTYTPDAGHVGPDTFTYRVCDTSGLCAEAEVTVTTSEVPEEPPANRPPTVVDDVVRRDGNRPIRIDILGNDTDPDGNLDPSSVRIVSGPQHGQITVDPETGVITYVPDPGWSGADSFTYEVCDTDGACRVATVTIEGTAAGAPTLPDTAMGAPVTSTLVMLLGPALALVMLAGSVAVALRVARGAPTRGLTPSGEGKRQARSSAP